MSLSYTEVWGKEILHLALLDVVTDEETNRLMYLIDLADFTEDIRVIQALMKCLQNDEGGLDETYNNTLSSVSSHNYYMALFEFISEFFENNNHPDLVMALLETHAGYSSGEYTQKIWSDIYNLAKKYLSIKNLEDIFLTYKENGYDCYEEDYPWPEFYQLFQKLLKEKSEE